MIKVNNTHKEIIRYIIFGILTTIINYISYVILTRIFTVSELYSVAIAWIISIIFAFITNKFFVFNNKNNFILKEFALFTGSRVSTLLLDLSLMFILVKVLLFNDLVCKAIINILVIVLNYILSKFLVFKKVVK